MTSKGLAKAHNLKLIEETSRHDLEGHEKALVLKLIVETSRQDLERDCNGPRPETN